MSDSPITLDLLCPRCGYNLRGLPQYRCPECGEQYDPQLISQSQLPWAHRRRIGWYAAYWRTVKLVLRHPGVLRDELDREVSYADSQRFRWLTVLHAGLAVTLVILWAGPAELWSKFGLILSTWLSLAASGGLVSYSFTWKRVPVETQNRAIALSYYAGAPLALTPALCLFTSAAVWFSPVAMLACAAAVLALEIALTWPALILLARAVRGRRRGAGLVPSLQIEFVATAAFIGVWVFVWLVCVWLGLVYYSLKA